MNCSSCYEIKVECCKDFTLPTALTPATSYYVSFSKPGSTTFFQKLLTSDDAGNILISKADFPAGFFVAGVFYVVEIRLASNYNTIVALTFEGDVYKCMLVETVEINPDNAIPGVPDASKSNVLTLDTDGSFAMPQGMIITGIIVDSPVDFTLSIGTTNGGNNIVDALPIIGGTPEPITLMIYAKVVQTIYFTGIEAPTNFIILQD